MNTRDEQQLAQKIERCVRSMRGDILSFTRDLVAIPTENPPGSHYRQCVELISKKLVAMELRPRSIKVHGGDRLHPRYCLMVPYGSGKKKLYFHGHYDVVPGLNPEQFKPRIRKGRFYGRGAADMKAGLAAMVYAVRALQLVGVSMEGQIWLVFVPDEETGGALGTRYLFDEGYIGRDDCVGMLMPEPTGDVAWNACRGAISLSVSIKGKPVHVVLQKEGINAFEQMVALLNALVKLKESVERRTTRYSVALGESKNSILMLGGVCRCGTNFNVVPGTCTFTIERRINPEENFAKEKKRLMDVLAKFRKSGMKISVEILQEGESGGVSSSSDLADALGWSVRRTTNRPLRFNMCPGLLEIRYYLRNGIPAYAYGPGSIRRAHHPQEYVEVDRVLQCATVYALTALRMLSTGEHA
ncbi:MAG: ArgE/DapE family deacylase [candidate division WOR-3 bacterium]|nr:MAG: ArgE/DapE family deacylase [candidate division WOR-3 bacterium]